MPFDLKNLKTFGFVDSSAINCKNKLLPCLLT